MSSEPADDVVPLANLEHTMPVETAHRIRIPYLAAALAALVAGLGAYALWPPEPPPAGLADKVVVIKSQRALLLMREGQVLKSYRVSLGRDPAGPKVRAGDNKTPEGSYILDSRNLNSSFYLSMHVSYPNSADIANARRLGVAPGGDIMIHGIRNGLGWLGRLHRAVNWTDGCIAVTNAEMVQIWSAVPDETPIEIRH